MSAKKEKSAAKRGRPIAWYVWTMAYVAQEVRKRRPEVTAAEAARAGILVMCRAFSLEGERMPDRPDEVYEAAVMKHLQELENSRKSIPQYDSVPQDYLDDAVEGALQYLDHPD